VASIGGNAVQMPAYWKWLNRITPTTWILYALASNQVLHCACLHAVGYRALSSTAGVVCDIKPCADLIILPAIL